MSGEGEGFRGVVSNVLKALSALLLVFASSQPVWADAEPLLPQERLAHVSAALRQLDFKGVFSFEQGGHQSTLQWVHAVRDGIERERLLGLDGSHREVLRERPAGCMQRSERVMHSYLMSSLRGEDSVGHLSSHYRFAWGERERVAGRESDALLIQPKDEYRYGYRLLVDRETGLLLGADMVNAQQAVLERFRFLDVQIGGVTAVDLEPVSADPMRVDVSDCGQQEETGNAQSPWQFDLPPGFTLCSYEARSIGKDSVAEDVQTYTDGLNHFTVFVAAGGGASGDGASEEPVAQLQHGNTLLARETVEINGARHIVTVVGEIPDVTARRVINSLAVAPSAKP